MGLRLVSSSFSLIILVLSFLQILSRANCFTISESVRLRVLEFDGESGKLVQVLTSRGSDLVYGENVGEGSQIVLECRSPEGPVLFGYEGDGAPEFVTSTNVTRASGQILHWTFLSFPKRMSAEDTGNYTCNLVGNVGERNSLHLYVPDSNSIFVPSRTARVERPKNGIFRIPCSVTHPAAKVMLERSFGSSSSSHEERLVTYSPKTGFLIPVSMLAARGPSAFVCKAFFRGKEAETEFRIFSEAGGFPNSGIEPEAETFAVRPTAAQKPSHDGPGLRSACSAGTCGRNAECVVIDYAAHCVCLEGFSGDPWSNCRRMRGHETSQLLSSDPCIPNPCEAGVSCLVLNGHAVCTCEGSHLGVPTVCRNQKRARKPEQLKLDRKCLTDEDCPFDQACSRRAGVCELACDALSCAQNANCRGLNHRPFCECKRGFRGSPWKGANNPQGCQLPATATTPRPLKGDDSDIFGDREQLLCNRTRCGVRAGCKLVNGQISCFCPAGTSGNPLVRCFPSTPSTEPCHQCGPNSVCTLRSGRVFCECLQNAVGSPPNCSLAFPKVVIKRPEEFEERNDEEREHPCKINCGPNTVCRVVSPDEIAEYKDRLRKKDRNRAQGQGQIQGQRGSPEGQGYYSECRCREGYRGNPYAVSGCSPPLNLREETASFGTERPKLLLSEERNPCNPSPCGSNSFCRGHNGKAFCSCDFSSQGKPPNCKRKCESDSHCGKGNVAEICLRGVCVEGRRRFV